MQAGQLIGIPTLKRGSSRSHHVLISTLVSKFTKDGALYDSFLKKRGQKFSILFTGSSKHGGHVSSSATLISRIVLPLIMFLDPMGIPKGSILK
jgi:hypothetical protein